MPTVGTVDVAIVGGGFAGSCAAHVLGRSGARVVLIDRAADFPDVFRAEKIEPDQANMMRELDLLELRDPVRGPLGVTTNFEGVVATPFDTVEQYGIGYSSTVNKLRGHLPSGVKMIINRVAQVTSSESGPEVRFQNGGGVRARLVILATGGSNDLVSSLGIRRHFEPSLVSLSFGFDIERADRQAFGFNGFNYFLPRNPALIDFVTIFPIGERMRVNLFTQLRARDDLVDEIRKDVVKALYDYFPLFRREVGEIRLIGRVQVVPTGFYRLGNAARRGIVAIGEEFQSVSPATGRGLSRALTDVRVLCKAYAPDWLESASITRRQVREYYTDSEKVKSDDEALEAWIYYHNKALPDEVTLKLRLRQRLKLMGVIR